VEAEAEKYSSLFQGFSKLDRDERLSRLVEMGALTTEDTRFLRAGAQVPIELAEKFIETVLAGAAEYDNAIRKQRCSDGMSQKINQGLYPWKTPLGYVCNNSKKRGEKKTQPDPPDEKIFPIIQKGLKHYAQGLCTQVELMKLLDHWGLAAARGRETTLQLVDRMIGPFVGLMEGYYRVCGDHCCLHAVAVTGDPSELCT